MAKHRHDDAQAEKERQRSEHQQCADDQAPHSHRHRVLAHRPDRGQQRDRRPHIAVDQERKRHHADRQHERGKQQTDRVADNDEDPAGLCGQHVVHELAERLRRGVAECRDIDGIRNRDPDQKNQRQQNTQHDNRADRGGLHDIQAVRGGGFQPCLAPPAQLVDSDRRDWANQREAARQRIKQRQDFIAKDQPRQHKADQRINDAQEYGMRRHRVEIIKALGQGVPEVGNAYAPNCDARRVCACTEQNVGMRHDCLPKYGVQAIGSR